MSKSEPDLNRIYLYPVQPIQLIYLYLVQPIQSNLFIFGSTGLTDLTDSFIFGSTGSTDLFIFGSTEFIYIFYNKCSKKNFYI